MYHSVSNNGRGGIDRDITVSRKRFEEQMAYLKRHVNVVSLDSIVEGIGTRPKLSKDQVAITFDDGYKDNYLNAYGILRKYNFPATIFLISQEVNINEKMLNSNNIKTMRNGRINYGSHSVSHKILSKVDVETATKEIAISKEALEHIVNQEVKYFAYPKGKKEHFNTRIKMEVKKAGYKAAVATENGEIRNDSDLFELKRLGIRSYPLFVMQARMSGIFERGPVYLIRKVMRLT
jgi:peptidoglycan/xylan/chitin deacetylase (PgdA/CDA1 family)